MTNTNIRCLNGEWKPRSAFSARQLSKYDKEVRTGRATPKNSGIRCTEHSAPQIRNLECQGPCGRIRPETLFSKSTKRNGTYWCVDCVDSNVRAEIDEAFDAPGEELDPGAYQPGMTSYTVQVDDDEDFVVQSGMTSYTVQVDDDEGLVVVANADNATAAANVAEDAHGANGAHGASTANVNLPIQANVGHTEVPFVSVPSLAQAVADAISTPSAAQSSEAVRNEEPLELCTEYFDYLDFLERLNKLFLEVAKTRPPTWIIPDLTDAWQDELAWVQKKQSKRVAKVEKAWPKPESTRKLAPRIPDYQRADIKTFQDDEWL
ncbi:hypothetical protein VTJ49DRAFT_6712 [Mycothermus thermophilus]|uniref:Stc1 domain-containing protein n=1 Tax=Humicola insolens TaxID=85995 RepID=A0ABR3VIG4_HUMIN